MIMTKLVFSVTFAVIAIAFTISTIFQPSPPHHVPATTVAESSNDIPVKKNIRRNKIQKANKVVIPT